MTDAIERTLELAASPERVWQAITDPAELSRWFGHEVELELQPGGAGWFGWPHDGRFHARVELVDAPNRLTWRWARDRDTPVDAGPSTVVEWTLTRRADGGTTLSLRETGFVRPEDRAENDEGWTEELTELESYMRTADSSAGAPQPVH